MDNILQVQKKEGREKRNRKKIGKKEDDIREI